MTDEVKEETQEVVTPETETQVQTEQTDWEAKFKERDAQTKHWREKAEKAEERLKESEGKVNESAKPETAPAEPRPQEDVGALKEDVVMLRLGQKGYSEEESSFIRSYAKGRGVSALEVLDDEQIKVYITAVRDKEKLNEATPDPSSRTIKVGEKPIGQMTDKERRANWPTLVAQARRNVKK